MGVARHHSNPRKSFNMSLEQESKSLLNKFYNPKGTNTDEAEAIELLSQFPNPAAIKSIKSGGGRTLLHYACYEGWYDASRTLVDKYHVSPDAKNNGGVTPLYYACERGHLKLVQYLIEEGHSDPEREYGWTTPFQIACFYGHLDVVTYLVSKCGCDPLKTNKIGATPLSLACLNVKYDVVSFLLTTGKVDKASDKKLGRSCDQMFQSLVSCRRSHPFHPAFKVMVVGNQTAGKSTLVKAIEIRLTDTSVLGSLTGHFTKVTGVELRTAGIIPTHIHSTKLGHIILYDFAGQYEYYSSHAAYLENLVCSPGVLFLLVVDISKSTEEIVRTLQYWNSFIGNLSHRNANNRNAEKPQIVVIGSHADVVKSQGQLPLEKLNTACDKVDSSSPTSLKESQVIIDCTRSASSQLSSVTSIIATCSETFHRECEVDTQVHLLNGVVKQKFGTATKFINVGQFVSSEKNRQFRENNLLPSDDATVSKHLTTLSEHGQLLYLRNDQDINDSWVILDKELLLSQVNGTIFAPDYFKQHHDISSSTGVVPLSEIKKTFPEHDAQMIVSFLTHLEFCHQIGESEALLISRGQLKSSDSLSESYYFFPALVSEERPDDSCMSIVASDHKSGWCLERARNDQFFTTRFLHSLLLRLAFSFALPPDSANADEICPVVQRKCNVWKSGIHWQNMSGVEAIVEVVEQSTAVSVVVGSQEGGEMASIQLRSDLIRTILEIKEKFSGAVEVKESVITPSELNNYPLKNPKDVSSFSIESIAATIANEEKFVTRKQGFKQQSMPIEKLLLFEPFSCISDNNIKKLFDESNTKKELGMTFLSQLGKKAHPKASELQQVLGVDSSDLQAAVRASPPSVRDDPAHQCYLMFKIWKEKGSRSYGDLRSALDKYSVFFGRNPLVLAGVSTYVKGVDQSPDQKDASHPLGPTNRTKPTPPTHSGKRSLLKFEEQTEPHGDDHRASLPQKSDRPTLKDLQLLKCRGGRRLRVIESVAPDWKYLATSLGIEGPVIRSIEMGAHFQPEEACHQVFIKWLDGGDGLCEPVTWGTLIQCLIEAGLVGVAEELEEVLG